MRGPAQNIAALLLLFALCVPKCHGVAKPKHYIAAIGRGGSSFDSGGFPGAPPTRYGQPLETVEDRAAAWRQYQQKRYENQSEVDAASPRDEDGRMKLLASVSRGSISLFFFLLMWRSVHHYELADSVRHSARLLLVLPTVALFIGNMAGCVASITSPTHSAKKRMKAILNLNKLVEVLLFLYNVVRLTVFPNRYVLREIYVGRTLINFLFIVQCQLFTKVAWGVTQTNKDAVQFSYDPPYEEDFGPGEQLLQENDDSRYGYGTAEDYGQYVDDGNYADLQQPSQQQQYEKSADKTNWR